MNVDIGVIISLFGVALSVATFFIGRQTASRSAGKENGIMLTEIGYIKSGIDDMKRKMDENERKYHDLSERMAALEEDNKSHSNANKRMFEAIENVNATVAKHETRITILEKNKTA